MELTATLKKLSTTNAILPLIILCEGFVSIAIEILAIRQLLPVVGGSVIVTSLIIGIFLLFLALGYRKGGRVEGDLQRILRFNFLLAAIWLGIGLSYLFISYFFLISEKIVGEYVVYQLMLYLILILAPLIYILGQTVPITMNLTRNEKRVGTIGGDALGVSTVGSFLGATITALLFMQYLGVAWTIVINVGILLGLVVILSTEKQQLIFNLFLAAVILWVVFDLNAGVERSTFVLTNNYANYQIATAPAYHLKDNQKMLVSNNSYSSLIDDEQKGFPYIEYVKNVLFTDLEMRDKNILVLGAGGFTLSAENNYGNTITYVDIDHSIKDVVFPRFQENFNDHFIADDARHFIRSSKNKYDAIVVDAYSNIRSIPSYLLTYEFMSELRERLTDNGYAIFNVIGRPTLIDSYSKRIDNTIRSVFRSCMSTPLRYNNNITNIVYLCTKNSENQDKLVYTDNLNTSTTDAFAWKI